MIVHTIVDVGTYPQPHSWSRYFMTRSAAASLYLFYELNPELRESVRYVTAAFNLRRVP